MNKTNTPEFWRAPREPGYGTFPFPFNHIDKNQEDMQISSCASLIRALECGYHHIDTAFAYRNQGQIGIVMKDLGLNRENIFVTSKLHAYNNSYLEAEQKIKEAIDIIWGNNAAPTHRYLDSFLIHYPGYGAPAEAWRAMQEARRSGLVNHIGVSNFEVQHLESLKKICGEYPEINQIEFHPWIYIEQMETIRFCLINEIAVEGYSPFAQGKAMREPLLEILALKYDTSVARIILKWSMQHGVLPIIGSRNSVHIRENIEPYEFVLTREEVEQINNLGKAHPIRVAEQWSWNSKKIPFGGLKQPVTRFNVTGMLTWLCNRFFTLLEQY